MDEEVAVLVLPSTVVDDHVKGKCARARERPDHPENPERLDDLPELLLAMLLPLEEPGEGWE
jgi:DNA recombination-dependent growth factor C